MTPQLDKMLKNQTHLEDVHKKKKLLEINQDKVREKKLKDYECRMEKFERNRHMVKSHDNIELLSNKDSEFNESRLTVQQRLARTHFVPPSSDFLGAATDL